MRDPDAGAVSSTDTEASAGRALGSSRRIRDVENPGRRAGINTRRVRPACPLQLPRRKTSPRPRGGVTGLSCVNLLRMTFRPQFAKFPPSRIAEEGFTRGLSSLQSALNSDAVSGAAAGVRAHGKQRVGAECGSFRFRDTVAGWNWVAGIGELGVVHCRWQ